MVQFGSNGDTTCSSTATQFQYGVYAKTCAFNNYDDEIGIAGYGVTSVSITGSSNFFTPAPTNAPAIPQGSPTWSPTLTPTVNTNGVNTGYIVSYTYLSDSCSGQFYSWEAIPLGICNSATGTKIMNYDYVSNTALTYFYAGSDCSGFEIDVVPVDLGSCESSVSLVYSSTLPLLGEPGLLIR